MKGYTYCRDNDRLVCGHTIDTKYERERRKDFGSFRPHITIVVTESNECTEFFQVTRFFELEDCIDFLDPRFFSSWCEPMSEEVSFFDSPFTLGRIDGVSMFV